MDRWIVKYYYEKHDLKAENFYALHFEDAAGKAKMAIALLDPPANQWVHPTIVHLERL